MVSWVTYTSVGSEQDEYIVLTTNCSEGPAGQILENPNSSVPGVGVDVAAVATSDPLNVNICELINLVVPPEGTNL